MSLLKLLLIVLFRDHVKYITALHLGMVFEDSTSVPPIPQLHFQIFKRNETRCSES